MQTDTAETRTRRTTTTAPHAGAMLPLTTLVAMRNLSTLTGKEYARWIPASDLLAYAEAPKERKGIREGLALLEERGLARKMHARGWPYVTTFSRTPWNTNQYLWALHDECEDFVELRRRALLAGYEVTQSNHDGACLYSLALLLSNSSLEKETL